MTQITNVAAYKFVRLDRLTHRRKRLRTLAKRLELLGTILLSPEGINMFVAGADDSVQQWLDEIRQEPCLADLDAKLSYSDRRPFRRLLVKIKSEIITFSVFGIDPVESATPKLAPKTLKQWLDDDKPVTLLDVRNDYEVKLGAFENARPIGVEHFRQFPDAVDRLPDALKQNPVVMYCTGGIRCEKAGPLMQQRGFEEVYQLDGGILKYFEQCGGEHYVGECFVFDQRVGLDSGLRETETAMCFACQAPLSAREQESPDYVIGTSCPHCYRTPQESIAAAIEQRHRRLARVVCPLPGSTPYENRRPIAVPLRCDGWRLLDLLCELHPHVGRNRWQEAVTDGRLQRNGQPLTIDRKLCAGERIENVLPSTVEPYVNADIRILYEDASLVVVNKPAPLPIHPSGRFNRNSLIWILNKIYSPQRLRVAHRLDANTTGVIVLSRSRPIAGQLQPQFERGEVGKVYWAKVCGVPLEDEFECDMPIANEALRAGRRETADDGLPSLTKFRVLKRWKDTALLQVRPMTGRTNQIRVHAAHLGLPVCGDPTYGLPHGFEPRQTLGQGDPPLCLHARKITLRHPLNGKRVRFIAPPPDWYSP